MPDPSVDLARVGVTQRTSIQMVLVPYSNTNHVLHIYIWVERRVAIVARRFTRNQVRRGSVHRVKGMAYMCMKRGMSLKLHLPMLKAMVMVEMATPFFTEDHHHWC
jgi:hypothetical protein